LVLERQLTSNLFLNYSDVVQRIKMKNINKYGKGKGVIFFNWPYVTKKLGIEGEFSNAQMIIYLRRH
jgi:hypothetical protein